MSHVQSTSGTLGGTAHNLTFGATPIAGNAIVVLFGNTSSANVVTGVTDNKGNSYAEETPAGGFSIGGRRVYAYVAENFAGSGTTTVTVTTSSAVTLTIAIAEYSNVPTSGVVEDIATGTFTSATSVVSGLVTTTVTGSTIIGFLRAVVTDLGGITPAGGETERIEISTTTQFQDEIVAAASTYNSAWNWVNSASGGYIVLALKAAVVTNPVISSVDSDNIITAGQADATIAGTGFGADGAGAKIELLDGGITSLCTKLSWTSTLIHFAVVQGNVRYGAGRTIKITTNGALTDTHTVTLNVLSGSTQYTDAATPIALTFDTHGKPSRLTPKGSAADGTSDLSNCDQVEMTRTAGSGAFTVDPNLRFQWAQTMSHGQWRWHATGGAWSALIEWDLRGWFRTFVGPSIADQTYTANVTITPVNHSQRYADQNTVPIGGTYALVGGPVTGLVWNPGTGQETGNPTVPGTTSGLILRFTNTEDSFTDSNSFSRIIEAAPNPPFFTGTIGPSFSSILNATLTPILCGNNFQFCTSFAQTGGSALNTFGLTLNTETGTISGAGTLSGIYAGIIITGSGTGTPADSNAFNIEIVDPGQVTVPNVIGMQEQAGQASLEALGLQVRPGYIIGLPGFAGQIVDQNPLSPTVVSTGSIVTITVSKANVPNLYALSQAEAIVKCTPLGYTVGTVTPENSQNLPERIIRQTPVMGVSSDPRTTIDVVIGQEMNLGARTKRRWE